MNSNYTLRFPRTSRQAFGHDLKRSDFEGEAGDRFVGWVCAVGIAFIVGLALGGGL